MPLIVLGLLRARRADPDWQPPLDEALTICEPTTLLANVYAARAEAAWLAGDHDRARDEARRGLALTTEHSSPWLTGGLARWLARAGGQPGSVRAARPFALELDGESQAAAALWSELRCPYDVALAQMGGDVHALQTALATFETLGARAPARIAVARLRDHGVRTGARRRTTTADPHGLTERQREVLTLAGEGLTDGQIGARLHLSAKTVNHHITAALGKLGVHSRTEAIAKLREG